MKAALRQWLTGLVCLAGAAVPAMAAEIIVFPGELADALSRADAGDTLVLSPGRYPGHFLVEKPLSLVGEGAELDGEGQGTVLTIRAHDVSVQGLTIQGFGKDQYEKEAGIFIDGPWRNTTVTHCHFDGPGFGLYAEKSEAVRFEHNHVKGDASRFLLERGDGIHLQRVVGAEVHHNHFEGLRDGVYVESSAGAQISHNTMTVMRYPVHLMYVKGAEIYRNDAETIDSGYALMDSRRVNFHHNRIVGAKEFGVLLNMTQDSLVANNWVANITNPDSDDVFDGEGKGVFIYGAFNNEVRDNRFQQAEIGIMMALGGEGNKIHGNAFIDNKVQVKYVGDTLVEWSQDDRGNYWSDYNGWDLDGDGLGDTPFQPNDALDRLFWLYPEARFLMDSPVVKLIRFIQSQRPKLPEAGVTDHFPRVVPPAADFPMSETSS